MESLGVGPWHPKLLRGPFKPDLGVILGDDDTHPDEARGVDMLAPIKPHAGRVDC